MPTHWRELHESWLLTAAFWLLTSIAFWLVVRRKPRVECNVLLALYLLKSCAVAAYAWYHVFVFRGGDALLFWETALHMRELIASAPGLGWKVFFLEFCRDAPEVAAHFKEIEAERAYAYFRDARAFQVARLACLTSFVSGKNFLAVSHAFSLIGLGGMALIYSGLRRLAPVDAEKLATIIALGLPCVLFWSSGLHKDALVLFALGLCFWSGAACHCKKLPRVLAVLSAFLLLWLLKPFVLFWLAPCWGIWTGMVAINRFNWTESRKQRARAALFGGIVLTGALALTFSPFNWAYLWLEIYETRTLALGGQLLKEGAEGALRAAPDAPTAGEILPLLPLGFVSALYRPFIWEAHNAQALIAAIENLGLLALTFYMLRRAEWRQVARKFAQQPALWFLLPFGIGLAAFLGVSTAFFGTLVRYKIYAAPFFFGGLLLLQKEDERL